MADIKKNSIHFIFWLFGSLKEVNILQ